MKIAYIEKTDVYRNQITAEAAGYDKTANNLSEAASDLKSVKQQLAMEVRSRNDIDQQLDRLAQKLENFEGRVAALPSILRSYEQKIADADRAPEKVHEVKALVADIKKVDEINRYNNDRIKSTAFEIVGLKVNKTLNNVNSKKKELPVCPTDKNYTVIDAINNGFTVGKYTVRNAMITVLNSGWNLYVQNVKNGLNANALIEGVTGKHTYTKPLIMKDIMKTLSMMDGAKEKAVLVGEAKPILNYIKQFNAGDMEILEKMLDGKLGPWDIHKLEMDGKDVEAAKKVYELLQNIDNIQSRKCIMGFLTSLTEAAKLAKYGSNILKVTDYIFDVYADYSVQLEYLEAMKAGMKNTPHSVATEAVDELLWKYKNRANTLIADVGEFAVNELEKKGVSAVLNTLPYNAGHVVQVVYGVTDAVIELVDGDSIGAMESVSAILGYEKELWASFDSYKKKISEGKASGEDYANAQKIYEILLATQKRENESMAILDPSNPTYKNNVKELDKLINA